MLPGETSFPWLVRFLLFLGLVRVVVVQLAVEIAYRGEGRRDFPAQVTMHPFRDVRSTPLVRPESDIDIMRVRV